MGPSTKSVAMLRAGYGQWALGSGLCINMAGLLGVITRLRNAFRAPLRDSPKPRPDLHLVILGFGQRNGHMNGRMGEPVKRRARALGLLETRNQKLETGYLISPPPQSSPTSRLRVKLRRAEGERRLHIPSPLP